MFSWIGWLLYCCVCQLFALTGCRLYCLVGCLIGLLGSLIGGYWLGCLIANTIDGWGGGCLYGICNSVAMLAFIYFGFGLSLLCCVCILEYTVSRQVLWYGNWFWFVCIGCDVCSVCLGVCLWWFFGLWLIAVNLLCLFVIVVV